VPWTLQRYILAEMLKTFLLAALALTAVVGLGVGIVNVVKLGEVTTRQLLLLMALMLPLAAALTLPVAALFSAAATYGRLSADNEFVACRSGGINLHYLLLPAVVVSVLCAAVTFGLANFVIPAMAQNLNRYLTGDFSTVILRRLERPQGFSLGGAFRVFCDRAPEVASEPGLIVLQGVAFVEMDKEKSTWVRYGTAREARVQLVSEGDNLSIVADLIGMCGYDRKDDRALEGDQQRVGPVPLPGLGQLEVKFLNLQGLLHYYHQPQEWHKVRAAVAGLAAEARRQAVYDSLEQEWSDGKELLLEHGAVVYVLRSESAARQRDGSLELHHAVAVEQRPGLEVTYVADRAVLELTRGGPGEEPALQVGLHGARLAESTGARAGTGERKSFGPLAVPATLLEAVDQGVTAGLLDGSLAEDAPEPLVRKHAQALQARAAALREIVATLHERAAFSSSALLLVVLGAALGIIFRGAHLLTAFAISFVPSLVVFVAIASGKQMAHNSATPLLGLIVMWAGLGVVGVLDYLTLTRFLRR